jgi:hypothetical protein
MKCGAYEGHCCQRSDNDQYMVNGVVLVAMDVDVIPDEWFEWLEEAA